MNRFKNRSKHALCLWTYCLGILFLGNCCIGNLSAQTFGDTGEKPLNEAGYRLEIILFKVLNQNGAGKLSNSISDYNAPLLEDEILPVAGRPLADSTKGESGPGNAELEMPAARSETMENAWGHLRRSKNYRPIIYQQWQELKANTVDRHQAGGIVGLPVRIHGQEVLINTQITDKELNLIKMNLPELASQPATATNPGLVKNPETVVQRVNYQLDGNAKLIQGRFLHIKLDIEYREISAERPPKPQTKPALQQDDEWQLEQELAASTNRAYVATTTPPAENNSVEEQPNTQNETYYRIFEIKKTRQLQPQRIELFDNERFGILVYLQETSTELSSETGSDQQMPAELNETR